jgi:hypothetical protein
MDVLTENILCHVKLSSRLFLSCELHDQVLVSGLTLPDGCAEAELLYDSNVVQRSRRGYLLTMNRTCWSSLGSKNSLEMLE